MSDTHSSSGEEDVPHRESVHSQRMQLASNPDFVVTPQSTGSFLQTMIVPKNRTPSITPQGKYILGSPSSAAVLARNTTVEEPRIVTITHTPPIQDTGRTAAGSAVFLKKVSSQERSTRVSGISPITPADGFAKPITLVIKRSQEQGSTVYRTPHEQFDVPLSTSSSQRKSASRTHKEHKRSRSPAHTSSAVATDHRQSLAASPLQFKEPKMDPSQLSQGAPADLASLSFGPPLKNVTPKTIYGMEASLYNDLDAHGQARVYEHYVRKRDSSFASEAHSVNPNIVPATSLPSNSTASRGGQTLKGYTIPKIVPAAKQPASASKGKAPAPQGGISLPDGFRDIQVDLSRDTVPPQVTSQTIEPQQTRHGCMGKCAMPNCTNLVHIKAAHARCRLCLGADHDPSNCVKCQSLGKTQFYSAAKFFRNWRATGHPSVAPNRQVRAAFTEPPQVSRTEIPAQLSDTSSLAMDEEPQAKRAAIPSLLTGLYDFAPLKLQPPSDSHVLADLGKLFQEIKAPAQDLPPSKTPLATPASSVLSQHEKDLLEELEQRQVDEGPRQADFLQVMDTAGLILKTPFVQTPQPQVNLHLATLQKSAPQKRTCSVSFPEEFHTRVTSFLTGEKVAPTLDKEDVVAPWKAIANLYRVEQEDYHKFCDARLSANPATVPFLDALSQATQVVANPSVSVPQHQASAMHARIAAYTEIMATATHTALGNAVSALDQAKSLLGPQAGPFLDNLIQSLNMVQPLAAATADASRDQMRLASRSIARAIRQRRKAVLPKAKSEASAKILRQPPSGSCLMGEGFVETHTKLATVHSTVTTAAKTYIQVNKPAFKRPAPPLPKQSQPPRKRLATGNGNSTQVPFRGAAPRGRGANRGAHNQQRNPATETAQGAQSRGQQSWQDQDTRQPRGRGQQGQQDRGKSRGGKGRSHSKRGNRK